MAHHAPRFLALVQSAKLRIKEISIADVQQMQAARTTFFLIDVREDHEWGAGHLPGALHLGRGILERDVEQRFPDLAAPLVLYCGGGYRSALAADSLRQMGYSNVVSMDGGFRGWKESGLPVERDG